MKVYVDLTIEARRRLALLAKINRLREGQVLDKLIEQPFYYYIGSNTEKRDTVKCMFLTVNDLKAKARQANTSMSILVEKMLTFTDTFAKL